MYRMYYFKIVFILSLFKCTSCLGKMLGPSDFIYKMTENCPDLVQKGGIELTITQRKYNRTAHVFDLKLETEYDIGNDLTVELKGSIKKEGGYKQGSFLLKKPICEGFHITLGQVFHDFVKAIGFDDCPITAGSYFVEGFFFDNQKFQIPKVYGEYKMDYSIWKDDDLLRCFRSFYEFTPKQT